MALVHMVNSAGPQDPSLGIDQIFNGLEGGPPSTWLRVVKVLHLTAWLWCVAMGAAQLAQSSEGTRWETTDLGTLNMDDGWSCIMQYWFMMWQDFSIHWNFFKQVCAAWFLFACVLSAGRAGTTLIPIDRVMSCHVAWSIIPFSGNLEHLVALLQVRGESKDDLGQPRQKYHWERQNPAKINQSLGFWPCPFEAHISYHQLSLDKIKFVPYVEHGLSPCRLFHPHLVVS